MENALCRHTAKSGVNPSVRKTRQSRLAGVLATVATSGSLSADSLSHDPSTGDEARVQPLTEKRFNSCLGERVDGHVFHTWKTDRDLFRFPSVLRQTLTGWSSFFHSNSRTIMWISKKGPRALVDVWESGGVLLLRLRDTKLKCFFFPPICRILSQ